MKKHVLITFFGTRLQCLCAIGSSVPLGIQVTMLKLGSSFLSERSLIYTRQVVGWPTISRPDRPSSSSSTITTTYYYTTQWYCSFKAVAFSRRRGPARYLPTTQVGTSSTTSKAKSAMNSQSRRDLLWFQFNSLYTQKGSYWSCSEIYIYTFYRQNGNKMVAPLVELTSELLARASSTSEVLTLNLTNLLILIVLKALIFGFGLFSVGSSARSAEETSLSQADLSGGMCFIMYTSGAEEKLSCIQRTACEDPKTASEYSTAAKMVYKLHKMLG